MKKVKLLSLALISLLTCTLLASCSKDDKSVDPTVFEGTWGLTHAEGWIIEDGEKDEFNIDCNPLSPSSYDDEKMEIINTTGNNYRVDQYSYSKWSKAWVKNTTFTGTLNGNVFTYTADGETITMKILSVNETRMELEITHSNNDYYSKVSLRKL
ncbi:MAG: lipocalin family protein [Bacteroidaceae bacterium]|nr:lipocalin family protein [Bacteroidaceae bacterium]